MLQHMHIRLTELSASEFGSKLEGTFFGVWFMLGYYKIIYNMQSCSATLVIPVKAPADPVHTVTLAVATKKNVTFRSSKNTSCGNRSATRKQNLCHFLLLSSSSLPSGR